MSTISKPTTVQLDIGGTPYKVSLSLIESFPDSMLSSIISNKWKESSEEQIFIERDGHTFRYVLNYMRDGKVTLPKGECIEALCTELEYFGIEYDVTMISSNDNLNLPESIRTYRTYLKKFEFMRHAQAKNHIVSMITIDIINAALEKFASRDETMGFEVIYRGGSNSIENKLVYELNENIRDLNLLIHKVKTDYKNFEHTYHIIERSVYNIGVGVSPAKSS